MASHSGADKKIMEKRDEKKLLGALSVKEILGYVAAVVLFAAISWIYFYPNDVNGDVLQQHDIMQGVANGQEAKAFHEQTGEVTRWTNSLFGGMPTFQISPSYRSSGLLGWIQNIYSLYFPSPVSWIFMLMLGFFILMLSFNVRWYLAITGAIAYAFSSYFFIIIGAGHIWKLLVLAYVPPTLAGIVWCYRGKYLAGAAVAALFAALQLMSNHVQMTYYSLFIVVAMAIGYLVDAIKEKKIKRWCIATCSLAVAALLAVAANAPNLYLTYNYSKETIRGGHSELTPVGDKAGSNKTGKNGGLDKEYITGWSYGKAETFSLLVPNVKGGASNLPQKGHNIMLSLAQTDKAQNMAENGDISQNDYQYLQYFPQYFGDQPGTNGPVYVGALICALFLLGCAVVKGPVKWALLAVTVLSVLLSWGHNMMWLTDLFIDHFPLYNRFRTVSSILVIAELTMPLLAVLALQKALTEKDFMKNHARAVYASFGVCALICLALWLIPGLMGTYSQTETEQMVLTGQLQQMPTLGAAIEAVRHWLVSSDAMRSLMVLVIGFGILWAFLSGKLKTRPEVVAMLVTLVVLVDMYAVNKRYISSDSFVERNDVTTAEYTPRPVDTQILQDTAMNYRVFDRQHFMEAMPSYFHKAVGGYHAAKLTRYNDLIERQIANGNFEVLNMLNTKYLITDDNTAHVNPDALGNAWFVDSLTYVADADAEMSFLDDFSAARHAVADKQFSQVLGQAKPTTAGDTIFETSYAPNRLTYHSHSAQGGLAVFSEVYFPWGWIATIDGKQVPIGRVNYVLRALRLPAGDHSVEFRFQPTAVTTSDTVATWAIIGIYILLLLALNVGVYKAIKAQKRPSEPIKE